MVSSIIESKDLRSLTIEELSGSLKGHEGRLDVEQDHTEEKALYVKGASFREQGGRGGRGRGRGYHRGRGRGRGWNSNQGQGRWSPDQSHIRTSESTKHNKGVQCYACKKYGHIKSQYQFKGKETNVSKEAKEGDEELLFMATSEDVHGAGGTWLIDSGCSNHMSGNRSLFQQLKEVHNQTIKLGDGKSL